MPQFDLIFVRLTSLPIVALIFYVFHVYNRESEEVDYGTLMGQTSSGLNAKFQITVRQLKFWSNYR